MEDDPELLDRHADDLLHDRRPERTPLPNEDALRARQVAAVLRSAKPGSGLPSADFLQQMQRSIAGWAAEQSSTAAPGAGRPTRRRILITALGGIAAGVLATLGIERLQPRPAPGSGTSGSGMALVDRGTWKPVGAVTALPEATPVAFRSGALQGYLIREGGSVRALSAICTHMGCILNYSKLRSQFECPCHGATFDRAGQPSGNYEQSALPPLPAIQTRVERGEVEVYTA